MEKLFNLNPSLIERIINRYQTELNNQLKKNGDKKDEFHIKEKNNLIQNLQSVDRDNLSEIIEIAFQSSFEKEEGRFHHYSLVILPPQDSNEIDKLYVFEKEQSLTKLPKLAPSIENSSQKFYVWFDSNTKPVIWAFGNVISDFLALKVTTFSAGQIIIHIPPFSKTHFLVSLLKTGFVDKFPILTEIIRQSNDFIEFNKMLAVAKAPSENYDKESVSKQFYKYFFHPEHFQKIAQKMRYHLHGGTLLVVSDSTQIEKSIQESMPFKAKSNYEELKKAITEEENKFAKRIKNPPKTPFFSRLTPSEMINNKERTELLNLIGQLTAVDGATIITKDFDLIAFGAKIVSEKTEELETLKIKVKEPFENSLEETVEVSNFHGTRHQSVAKFVFEQKENAFGIVASQDGRVSVVYWNKESEQVHAIRHAEYLFL